MNAERFRFEAHPEHGDVSALLLRPDNADRLIVLGHGAGAGMEHANMENIASSFAKVGLATLRYQFPFMERGRGREPVQVSLSTVHSAVEFAEKQCPELPILAGGHSYGGRITSMAMAQGALGTVQGLVLCSYPLHAPGKPADSRAAHLPGIPVPCLFLSGTRDRMMSFDLLQPALDQMPAGTQFHWLETGDHGYKILKRSRPPGPDIFDEMAAVCREWLIDVFSA